MSHKKELLLFSGLSVIVAMVFVSLGAAYGFRMLAEASCYAIIALGLTIQWGYAGLFNAGVMGFIAVGGFMAMLISYPVNEAFWDSDSAAELVGVGMRLVIGALVITAMTQLHRIGAPKGWRSLAVTVAVAVTYLVVVSTLEPVANSIELKAGFIGGFGLPVWLGWIAGGVVAGAIAYGIGHICLGLRSDYLAIATLGIAEIIKAFLKNADWLTRGTLTVSPLPWPVPTPADIGFVGARAAYLSVTAALIVLIFLLLERAYRAPWGRMMRAIRDNETAASSMGKDVNRRRLEIFVVGSILMGTGGAALISFAGIFDPAGFLPLNHTFLIWVMVILGGAGNNLGAIFGALLVYIVWTMSEPGALFLFDIVRNVGADWFDWEAPKDLDSRALQMRVFVIGLTITLVLRLAPKGALPEKITRHE